MGIPVDSSKLITCQKRRGGGGGHDLCFLVIKKKYAEMLENPNSIYYLLGSHLSKKKRKITSWEVNLSRYIMMDLNEFPWAAIITFFPHRSWGSICAQEWHVIT
jgi:hypothetical protein